MRYPTRFTVSPTTALLGAAAIAAGAVVVRLLQKRAAERYERECREECLDHIIEDSFPASDPPPF